MFAAKFIRTEVSTAQMPHRDVLSAGWWSLEVMRERISQTALELEWEQKEDNGALIMKQPWCYMTGQDGLRPRLPA